MKKIILTTSLSVAILLIGISFSYYYFFFLPGRKIEQEEAERKEFLLSMKQECNRVGKELYEQDKEEWDKSLFDPEYAYNKDLETCLYSGGWIDVIDGKACWRRWIKDSYTNETIAAVIDLPGDNAEPQDKIIREFWEKHDELFSE